SGLTHAEATGERRVDSVRRGRGGSAAAVVPTSLAPGLPDLVREGVRAGIRKIPRAVRKHRSGNRTWNQVRTAESVGANEHAPSSERLVIARGCRGRIENDC